jgi:putative transposase
MGKLSYHRYRCPSIVIQQAIWLYFRFALGYRDVEDMLAGRGIDSSGIVYRGRCSVRFPRT